MKIAVTTPVKHLQGIESLLSTKGKIFYLEEGTKSEVRELLLKENIDVILCNPNQQTYKIDQELLENTTVSLINTCSTGMNHIDQEYCKLNEIKIYSLTKDYQLINNLPSTSELAFGLLLDLMRNITISNNEVKQNKTWDYLPFVGQQMKDFKVGIVGYGRLGKMMAKYCKAFDAEVYIFDPYSDESNVKELEDLFQICDAVSLHVHVSDETKYMIDYDLLSRNIKFLVNTSRGEIVKESDVIRALKEGKLWGYGADVIEDEFGDIKDSPFFSLENSKLNYIFTPHIGGMTIQGQTKAYTWAINKL
jgi:D-3-phosphoglycerate dehydrogenase